MMHLIQRQPEKLVVNVETSDHKTSLPEKINYRAQLTLKLVATFVDRHRDYRMYTVSIEVQLAKGAATR